MVSMQLLSISLVTWRRPPAANNPVPVEVVVTITACVFNDDLCAGGGGVSDFR